ncbi:NADH:flavin oxidoreductase/NADH oxidase [Sanghuangporus baumii]|uniref:NADH:flavin oxidoreductase/NADH oxidase n=1 Tax=Sanghuangporus baumii TaxID=108892 RepID=A0A9Q5NB71_SANBA|nr:NADH:flavin oxidoreductase/NADH oxidase [Sanghuangporus baumii]
MPRHSPKMSQLEAKLFQPIQVGNLQLSHRVVLPPLTRFRPGDDHVPNDMMVTYYRQRASVPGTLLIAESTFIAPKAGGMDNFPGIWSDEQVEAWKKVVDAVHAQGSYIFLQLLALGRAAVPVVLTRPDSPSNPGGPYPLVGPSAIPIPTADQSIIPRPLTHEEILECIDLYGQAVHRAGFDGVEIHGGNGCLVDQFIQDVSNKRTDQWGGSIENRIRFPLEVIKKHICKSSKLAWLRIKIGSDSSDNGTAYIGVGGYSPEAAIEAAEKNGGLVAFGRYLISNPDLPARIKKSISLTPYDRSTFYAPKSTYGYADYAFADKESEDHYEKVDKL